MAVSKNLFDDKQVKKTPEQIFSEKALMDVANLQKEGRLNDRIKNESANMDSGDSSSGREERFMNLPGKVQTATTSSSSNQTVSPAGEGKETQTPQDESVANKELRPPEQPVTGDNKEQTKKKKGRGRKSNAEKAAAKGVQEDIRVQQTVRVNEQTDKFIRTYATLRHLTLGEAIDEMSSFFMKNGLTKEERTVIEMVANTHIDGPKK